MNRMRTIIATTTLAAIVAGAGIAAFGSSSHRARAATEPVPTTVPTTPTSSASRVAVLQPDVDAALRQRMIHRPGQQVAGTDTGTWSSMEDFMTWVAEDTAAVWNWYYKQWGYNITSNAQLVFPAPGQSVATGCGNATHDRTMEYCPRNDTIYFSQALATALWNGTYVGPDGQRFTGPGGDFAVAVMLAHEYGHNVQSELNLLGGGSSPKIEQMADCLSGIFAQVAYYQNVLDANDVNEAIATAFMVGDSRYRDPSHGTSAQRVAAWKLGYNSGTGPAACWSLIS